MTTIHRTVLGASAVVLGVASFNNPRRAGIA